MLSDKVIEVHVVPFHNLGSQFLRQRWQTGILLGLAGKNG